MICPSTCQSTNQIPIPTTPGSSRLPVPGSRLLPAHPFELSTRYIATLRHRMLSTPFRSLRHLRPCCIGTLPSPPTRETSHSLTPGLPTIRTYGDGSRAESWAPHPCKSPPFHPPSDGSQARAFFETQSGTFPTPRFLLFSKGRPTYYVQIVNGQKMAKYSGTSIPSLICALYGW
jgi:hypothetical protein